MSERSRNAPERRRNQETSMTTTKCFYALLLALCSVALLMLWATSTAQAESEITETDTSAGAQRIAARNAFVCPDMHAEWLDDKTVQCLKMAP
jgi:hypothetical protein